MIELEIEKGLILLYSLGRRELGAGATNTLAESAAHSERKPLLLVGEKLAE